MDYPEIIYDNAWLLPCTTANKASLIAPGLGFAAVRDSIIVAIGDRGDAQGVKGSQTRVVDCQGQTLIPGFVDAHCHLLALVSRLCDTDCCPDKAGSITQLIGRMRKEARPPAPRSQTYRASPDTVSWRRGYGYDEFYLEEGRHPTRWDLDQVSRTHPVRLDHRTGHAMVLNSRALDLIHITSDTPDPTDGVIQRDDMTGEPTGVLFEMALWVNRRVGSTHDDDAKKKGLILANELFLSKGITSAQDATFTNDLARWNTFRSLKNFGCFTPRMSMLMGKDNVDSLVGGFQRHGALDTVLPLGAVKIVITMTTGVLHPSEEELRELVLTNHQRGLQVAMHAVEAEAVEAAADALLYAQSVLPRADARHRIEHCSECPPHLIEKLVASEAVVVSQPGFVYDVGDRYQALVAQDLRSHLYPFGDLIAADVIIAAGSDAPMSLPDPLAGISAAVTRKSRRGTYVASEQAISVEAALRMHTIGGAYANFEEHLKGSIDVGKLADFVLLDGDPTAVEPESIMDIRTMLTVLGGQVVWEG